MIDEQKTTKNSTLNQIGVYIVGGVLMGSAIGYLYVHFKLPLLFLWV